MPPPWQVDIWPWKWYPSHVWRTSGTSVPTLGPLCSGLRPDVRDRQTSDRRQTRIIAYAPGPRGRWHISNQALMLIRSSVFRGRSNLQLRGIACKGLQASGKIIYLKMFKNCRRYYSAALPRTRDRNYLCCEYKIASSYFFSRKLIHVPLIPSHSYQALYEQWFRKSSRTSPDYCACSNLTLQGPTKTCKSSSNTVLHTPTGMYYN